MEAPPLERGGAMERGWDARMLTQSRAPGKQLCAARAIAAASMP